MGYYSNGFGTMKLTPGITVEAFAKFASDEEFNADPRSDGDTTISISFDEWKLYHANGFFEKLAKFGDFEFEIEGEEAGDIWKLKGESGKLSVKKSKVVWDDKWSDVTDELG